MSADVAAAAEEIPAPAPVDSAEPAAALAPAPKRKHPLQNTWTVWYDNPGKKVSQQNWDQFVKKLNTFHTVEDFWCLHNNVVPPSKLMAGSNFHLFKEGIEPKWEDKANGNGGKWILVLPRSQRGNMDEYWLRLLLACIGEQFPDADEICGCVVSIRKSQDKIALWTRNAQNSEAVIAIGKEMRRALDLGDDLKLGYQVHADSLKRNSSYNNKNKFDA